MMRVLVTHPSAELYGSDRMLAESVHGLVDAGTDVVVALPSRGPLVPLLEAAGATVVGTSVPVLRKSSLRPAGALRLAVDGEADRLDRGEAAGGLAHGAGDRLGRRQVLGAAEVDVEGDEERASSDRDGARRRVNARRAEVRKAGGVGAGRSA